MTLVSSFNLCEVGRREVKWCTALSKKFTPLYSYNLHHPGKWLERARTVTLAPARKTNSVVKTFQIPCLLTQGKKSVSRGDEE